MTTTSRTCPECGGKGRVLYIQEFPRSEGYAASFRAEIETCHRCDGLGEEEVDNEDE